MTEILIFLLIFFTLASGFCSGSETALFSLPATRLRAYAYDKDPRKSKIANILKHPQDLIVTIFMLNTLTNILLQNTASTLFGRFAGWHLKVGVPLAITLFFGEIIPKIVAMENNVSFAKKIVMPIAFLHVKLKIFRQWILQTTLPLSRFIFSAWKRASEMQPEELTHAIEISEEKGVLSSTEALLFHGLLSLKNVQAGMIAHPKEDLLSFDMRAPLHMLENLFTRENLPQVIIHSGDLDNIPGILSAKAFLKHRHQIENSLDLIPYLEKPLYIPETMSCETLLKQLDAFDQKIGLIVNEYGTLSGFVYRKDIIARLFGKIPKLPADKHLYTLFGKREIIASGKLELNALNEILQVDLQSEHQMKTIGGWFIETLGFIPKAGFSKEHQHLYFHVLTATPKRIRKLYIRKLSLKK